MQIGQARNRTIIDTERNSKMLTDAFLSRLPTLHLLVARLFCLLCGIAVGQSLGMTSFIFKLCDILLIAHPDYLVIH